MTDAVEEIQNIVNEFKTLYQRYLKWYQENVFTVPFDTTFQFSMAKCSMGAAQVQLEDVERITRVFVNKKKARKNNE